jgi:hypothetical protein
MKVQPVSLARNHCANWIGHGTCVGTDVDLKTGRQSRWRPEGSPCFVTEVRRCPYLESAVLPMAAASWNWKSSLEGTAFRNAADQYRIQIVKEKPSKPAIRKCPDCQQNTISLRQRFCGECKAKRKTTTETASKRKWREKQSRVQELVENGSW